jgi:endonuclease YncB( thermonuclease family)
MARPERRPFGKIVFLILALAGLTALNSGPAAGQNTISVSSVKRVVSADTLVLANGKVVRMIGIVAPEAPEAAEQARQVTEELLLGRNIEVWVDGQNTPQQHLDQYGRLLCYVYLLPSRRMANAEIVRKGGAFLYGAHFIDQAARNNLVSAEYQARKAKLGLWAQATESPDEIAKRQGKTYSEPPFTLPPDPKAAEKQPEPSMTGPTVGRDPESPASKAPKAPELDNRTGYTGVRVEGCGLLETPQLGRLALIGVQNIPGKVGETARVEVARLIQGKKLRFSYDEVNADRGHRDKDGNLLVYATLPDGSLLNLQIVSRGISDVDIDYDYQFKSPMLTARDNARARQAGPRWGSTGTAFTIAQTREVILEILKKNYPGARYQNDRTLVIPIDDPDFRSTALSIYTTVITPLRRRLVLNGVEEVRFINPKTNSKTSYDITK